MPTFENLPRRISSASLTTLLALATALPLHGQQKSPWSLDFGSGFMRGRTTGVQSGGTGLGLSGQLSWQSRTVSSNAWLVGLNATGFMQIAGGSSCTLPQTGQVTVRYGSNLPLAYGDCTPHFPNGGGLGFLGGMEHRIGSSRAATRLAIGPMLFVTGEKRGSLGLQSRVDLTFRTFSRSQFVLWSQSGLAPTLGHGNSFLFSIGAGFRARDFIDRMRSEGAGPQGDCCDQIPKKRLPVIIRGFGR